MKRYVALVALAALLSGGVATRAEPPPTEGQDGTGWAMERLDLEITLGSEGAGVSVSGTAGLVLEDGASFGPTLGMNNRQVVFEFRRARVRDRSGGAVDLARRHPVAESARLADIRFDAPLSPGDRVRVDFEMESVGQSSQAVFGNGIALASWVEVWYPVPIVAGDDPLGAEKLPAPGTTTFHLPPGWSAVTNGARTDRRRSDDGVMEEWTADLPAARSWVAGPFQSSRKTFGNREIGVYLLSPKPVSAANQAKTLAAALAAMEARFGPYPYPSYAIVELPEGSVEWYASSEQGFIMARSAAFDVEGGNVPLFAHEAAHGWWGNLVNTTGPGAALCSESLAQYGAVVAIETLEGTDAMTEFLEYSREGYVELQCALGYFWIVGEGGDKPLAELARDRWDHNLSDSKGNWFYHMMRQRVGDDVFFETLRGLTRDFADEAMSLDDVRAAFTAAVPDDAGMERFLAQWLDRTGAPVIDVEWWSVDRGKGIEVVLTQRQAGDPYVLDVEIEIEMRGGERAREVIAVAERETRVTVATPARPVDVTLDPDAHLLLWRPRYGPVPEQLLAGLP